MFLIELFTFLQHHIAVPGLLNVDNIFDTRFWILDARWSFFVSRLDSCLRRNDKHAAFLIENLSCQSSIQGERIA
jgi:hypothetical protein